MSALQGGRRRQKQMGSKKELQAAIAVLGLCMLVFGCTKTAESENSKKQVKIGVAVYNEEDVYVSKICGYLEDEIFQYEKDHPGVEIRKKIADARGYPNSGGRHDRTVGDNRDVRQYDTR